MAARSILPAGYASKYAAAIEETDGLTGYWKLHGAGDLDDSSAGGHDAVQFSGSTISTDPDGIWAGTTALNVIDSGGYNGSLDIGPSKFGGGTFGSALYSIEGWVNANDGAQSCSADILYQFGWDFLSTYLSLLNADGSSEAISGNPAGPDVYKYGPWLHGWHQLAVTVGDDLMVLYVDGEPVAQETGSAGIPLGGSYGNVTLAGVSSSDCKTLFSDISVYSKALTAKEIAGHYSAAGAVLPLSYQELLGGSNPAEFCNSCFVGHQLSQIGNPVDAATGNFYHQFSDIGLASRAPSFGIERTYNSLAASHGYWSEFGYGWSWNYGAHLELTEDAGGNSVAATLVQASGAQVFFTKDQSSGEWVAPSNVFATLSEDASGVYTVAVAGATTYTFASAGAQWAQLTSITDRNGYTTSLDWPSTVPGTLVVSDGSGSQYLYVMLDSNMQVTSVSDSVGRTVNYCYSGPNCASGPASDLVSVSTLRGGSWHFAYDSVDQMISMTDPSGGTTTNRFDSDGRVVEQWDPVATAGESGSPTDASAATTFEYSEFGGDGPKVVITGPTGVAMEQSFVAGYLASATRGSGPAASTTSFTYDPLTSGGESVVDPSGNVTHLRYFPSGYLESSTDPLGNTTSYADYTSGGSPGSVTDPSGVTTTFTYDAHGNATSSLTPWSGHSGDPASTQHLYDPTYPGDVTQSIQADGTVTQYGHDPVTGQVTSVTGPDGVTTFGYDLAGHQTWSISPAGNATGGTPGKHRSAAVINPAGQTLESLDPLGEPVADGFVRSATSLGATATGETWHVWSGSWAVAPGVASVSDTTGGVALATVPNSGDPGEGMVASMIVADGTSNYTGVAFRVKDANNYWFVRQIPLFGGLAMYKTVGGVTTQVAGYETGIGTGDRIMVSSVGSHVVVYRNGVQLDELGGSGEVIDTDLDTFATAGLIGFAAGPVAAGFSTHTPNGAVTDAWFDEAGRVVKTAGPRLVASGEEITTAAYDAAGRPVKATDANGHATVTEYDLAGRIITQRVGVTSSDANGSGSTSYTYDSQGRVASTHAAGKPATEFTYTDASGSNPATRVVNEPSGATVTTTFDAASRPMSIAYSDATPTVTFTYDANGRVTDEDSAGSGADVTRTYDSLGQITSVTRAQRLVTYTYDRPGRISKIKYPFGKMITRGYDAVGRWNAVTDWNNQTTSFGYDADGNIATVATPNGVTTTRGHNANGAIDHISIDDATTTLADWDYTRDHAQNLTGVSATGLGANKTWDYDAVGQLTDQSGTPAQSYAYDPANQPVTVANTAQAFNAAGEICWTAPVATAGGGRDCANKPSGGTSFHYNDNGQRTGEGSTGLYHWNAAGQLTWSGRGVATAYLYDPAGLRIQATYSGEYHRYSWDDTAGVPQLIGDQNPAHNITFLYGPDGLPFEQIDTTTATSTWLHQDATGSIRCTTNDTGNVTSTQTWTPWGELADSTGTPPRLGYKSKSTDPSGLIYLQARYYDPTTAQFLSVDPLDAITLTRFGYADNNPLNETDPDGLRPRMCGSPSADAVGPFLPCQDTTVYNRRAANSSLNFSSRGYPRSSEIVITIANLSPFDMLARIDSGSNSLVNGRSTSIAQWLAPGQSFSFALGTSLVSEYNQYDCILDAASMHIDVSAGIVATILAGLRGESLDPTYLISYEWTVRGDPLDRTDAFEPHYPWSR